MCGCMYVNEINVCKNILSNADERVDKIWLNINKEERYSITLHSLFNDPIILQEKLPLSN